MNLLADYIYYTTPLTEDQSQDFAQQIADGTAALSPLQLENLNRDFQNWLQQSI